MMVNSLGYKGGILYRAHLKNFSSSETLLLHVTVAQPLLEQ